MATVPHQGVRLFYGGDARAQHLAGQRSAAEDGQALQLAHALQDGNSMC